MSNQSSEAPRLSDTQLAEVLALTKDAGSVKLKLTVPDPARRATVQGCRRAQGIPLRERSRPLRRTANESAALEYFAASLGTAAEA